MRLNHHNLHAGAQPGRKVIEESQRQRHHNHKEEYSEIFFCCVNWDKNRLICACKLTEHQSHWSH